MAETSVFADLLDSAMRLGVSLSPFARRHGLTLPEAYEIQEALAARRLARGESLSGVKLGFTSEAMRAQMGVKSPNIGWLTREMQISDGILPTAAFIHARLEPEVAVLLSKDISETEDEKSLRQCIAAFAPAIEIVNSRFHDYRFDALDNIADNSSSAAYALGPWVAPDFDLAALNVSLTIGGREVDEGTGAAAMGHPLLALAEGARIAASRAKILRAGMIVLTGGLTRAHPIEFGQRAVADFGPFGRLELMAR